MEIWINGFDLQCAGNETTGTLEVSFSFAFIQDCLARPSARINVNQGIVSPQRACDIFFSILHALASGLELDFQDLQELEIIRLDAFCDFQTPNHKEVLEIFRNHKPNVFKTPNKNSREFDDHGVTHYRKSNIRRSKFKGMEETKLYSRMAKLQARLQDAVNRRRLSAEARDDVVDTLGHLQDILRLEAVHGREKRSSCKGFNQLADFTLEPTNDSLKIQDAFNPALWAGLLLTRLKECGLYGHALNIVPSRLDLLRIVLDHGVTPGTASQFILIIFEGVTACKSLGLPVGRIKREVERKTGHTFAAFAASVGQVSNPFDSVVDACLRLLRSSKIPVTVDSGLVRFDGEMPDYPTGAVAPPGSIPQRCQVLELAL